MKKLGQLLDIQFALLLLTVIISSNYYHQTYAQNHQANYDFLKVKQASRTVALGSQIISDGNQDVFSYISNPALNPQNEDQKFSSYYTNYISDIQTANINYQQRIKKRNYHASIQYRNYGDFQGYDTEGNYTQDFTASDIVIYIGTSFSFPKLIDKERFRIGINLGGLSSQYEQYKSKAIFTNLGAYYSNKSKKHQFGIHINQLGVIISHYTNTKINLPILYHIGYTYNVQKFPIKFHLNFEDISLFNKPIEIDKHLRLGVEWMSESNFGIRIGYNPNMNTELGIANENTRNTSGISGGIHFNIKKAKVECSYARYHKAGNQLTFGLQLQLSKSNERPK